MTFERLCRACRQKFNPKGPHHSFCSAACRSTRAPEIYTHEDIADMYRSAKVEKIHAVMAALAGRSSIERLFSLAGDAISKYLPEDRATIH